MEDFNKLYDAYSEQIFKYLLYITGKRDTAEELLQETYYQAFKSIYRFKGKSKVSTWLYQISKHVYLKHLSKESKHKAESIQAAENLADNSTPERITEERETNNALVEAIHSLKEPYREVIILRAFNDLSFKEIGDIFSQSEGWARTIFYRGKLQLKEILNKNKWE